MARHVSYDKINNILFADYTNLTITKELFDEVMEEAREMAAQLPEKVYLLVCLQNSKVAPELQGIWGKYTQEALQYLKGIVRYQATDVITNITIRSSTVRYRVQGINSYIYPNRQTALEAIRYSEQVEKQCVQ